MLWLSALLILNLKYIIMSVSTYTRKAKCKDCVFISKYYVGNKNVHKCSNVYSERSEKHVKLNDFVCSKWSLIYNTKE